MNRESKSASQRITRFLRVERTSGHLYDSKGEYKRKSNQRYGKRLPSSPRPIGSNRTLHFKASAKDNVTGIEPVESHEERDQWRGLIRLGFRLASFSRVVRRATVDAFSGLVGSPVAVVLYMKGLSDRFMAIPDR